MLKKTITFADLDGNSVTEDFYFNFTKAELAEMELGKQGGMQEHLERILKINDASAIITEFKHIILGAVGKRSEDGRRFIKSREIREEFEQTEAYSELFMELLTTPETVKDFISGLMPKGLATEVQRVDAKILPAPAVDPKPWITENREPTATELRSMSRDDIVEVMSRKVLAKKDLTNDDEQAIRNAAEGFSN